MTTQIHDQLFDVPTHSVEISLGTFSLPFFIYEATNLTAIFRAQRDQAEALLQGTGLEPAFVMGPWALVALTFFQYRASSAGEYNEVGLMLPAVRQGQGRLLRSLVDLAHHLEDREMGMYVVDLPVTTELACASGRELWGYPKFRTQIPFHLQGRQFRSQVFQPDSGQVILTMAGKMTPGAPIPTPDFVTYSLRERQLVRTPVRLRAPVRFSVPTSMRLLAGSSSHPMAGRLRQLGLHGAKPLCVLTSDHCQARLGVGEVL